jgi:hypothetical protein
MKDHKKMDIGTKHIQWNGAKQQEAIDILLGKGHMIVSPTKVGYIISKRPRNAPVGSGRFVMDSVYERRVWSGGWSWPRGDRAVGRFVSDEWHGTK